MRGLFIIVFSLLLPLTALPQKLAENCYWIRLKDKAGNQYTLNNPETFLSERSIERRMKQGIPVTIEDMPVSQIYIDSLENLGLKILGISKWFNSVVIESTDYLLLDTLDNISFISEFNPFIPLKKSKNEPSALKKDKFINDFDSILSLDYGLSFSQTTMLNGQFLHNSGFLGGGKQIAVIDGGFYQANTISAFDSVWENGQILGYRDFSHSKTDFFNTSSHGMSVLSTMAANIPGKMIGTAPLASYYLLKSEIVESETKLEEAYWVMAAEFADSAGVDIITSSLGYSEFDEPDMDYTYNDMDGKTALCTQAAEKAFSKGMVVIVSAGNSGNKSWHYITAPSDGANVLAIGATDTLKRVVPFSSRGPSPDSRVKPDILAVGYKTIIVHSSGSLVEGYGTSFSAPQIAGMMACLWEAEPDKTNSELINAVRTSASHFLHPNDSMGFGVPDFQLALLLLQRISGEVPEGELQVMPNPNSGIFEVYSDKLQNSTAKIGVYNLLGEQIYSGETDFDGGYARITEMSNQNEGFYIIVAESGGKKHIGSFIITLP